jgi:serine/threonine protein kinase
MSCFVAVLHFMVNLEANYLIKFQKACMILMCLNGITSQNLVNDKKFISVAKDLIRQCLIVDPQKRLTAEQILNHSWLQTESKTDLLPAATKYFNARDRFKRAGNAVIGLQRLKKASGEHLACEVPIN